MGFYLNNIDNQREQIKSEINCYFDDEIDIFPRAMASLQSDWVEVTDEEDDLSSIVCISILRSLIENSPAIYRISQNIGLDFEQIYKFACSDIKRNNNYTAYFPYENLEYMFQGDISGYKSKLLRSYDSKCYSTIDDYPLLSNFNLSLSKTAQSIIKKKTIDEFDLFSSLIETSVISIGELSKEQNGKMFSSVAMTDIGHVFKLSKASFLKGNDVWDGEPGSYFEGINIKKLEVAKLSMYKEINKMKIIDPSHWQQQLGLFLNDKNKIEITKFGSSEIFNISTTNNIFPVRSSLIQQHNSSIFNDESIELFTDMINSKNCSEADFQNFFMKYNEYFNMLGYKNILSQPVLIGDNAPNRKPDFILEPISYKSCDILDLKLPNYNKGIVKQKKDNIRVRFKDVIYELHAQLHEYGKYFDDKANRDYFKKEYGLDAYKPKLIGIIGRNNDFKSDFNRQDLKSLIPNIEIITYDDILEKAKFYKNLIKK